MIRRMTGMLLAATLTGSALYVSASAAAQDAHGVIAFGMQTDQANGVTYGIAWNFPAKDSAHAAAVNACISSGGTNCSELVWIKNGCGALAIDQHGNAQGKPGMTREQAETRALQMCEAAGGAGCNIVGSLCTTPDGDPDTYSGSESVLPMQDRQTMAAGPEDELLTRDERVLVQQALNALGFDAGPADGVFGPRTRSAIWDWQSANDLEVTGYLTQEEAEALGALGQADEVPNKGFSSEDTEPEERAPQESAPEPSASRNAVLHFPQCSDFDQWDVEFPGCWKEISNRQDCDFFLSPSEVFYFEVYFDVLRKLRFTWSAKCRYNAAHGQGKLEADFMTERGPESVSQSGNFVEGKKSGSWVLRWRRSNGDEGTDKGSYVDGLRHGRWIEQYSIDEEEFIEEGPYENDLRHGRWIWRGYNEREYFECYQMLPWPLGSSCERLD